MKTGSEVIGHLMLYINASPSHCLRGQYPTFGLQPPWEDVPELPGWAAAHPRRVVVHPVFVSNQAWIAHLRCQSSTYTHTHTHTYMITLLVPRLFHSA